LNGNIVVLCNYKILIVSDLYNFKAKKNALYTKSTKKKGGEMRRKKFVEDNIYKQKWKDVEEK